MINALAITAIVGSYLCLRVYPRQTMITAAIIIVIVILYPLIMNMSIEGLIDQCSCN